MNEHEILFVEPTMYQRGVGLVLALILIAFTVWRIKNFQLKEEHALPWLLGGVFLVILCLFLPVLKLFTQLIGAGSPTTALFAGTLFFLLVQSLSLTSTVSRQKKQIEKLTIELALHRNTLDEKSEASQAGGKDG